jgi:hypothetical protein
MSSSTTPDPESVPWVHPGAGASWVNVSFLLQLTDEPQLLEAFPSALADWCSLEIGDLILDSSPRGENFYNGG